MSNILERIEGGFAQTNAGFRLADHLVALGFVGSVSHGTHLPDVIDDTDLMGIVVPPARHVIGLGRWEHWVYQENELDVVLYSAEKMVRLLLKSNPNVLGFLWLRPEHYVHWTPWLDRMIAERDTFTSKAAYNSFAGYAHSQLRKLHKGAYRGYMGAKRKALVDKHGYDPKNACHLIRLLRMATEFLETGEMTVYRQHDREELLAIKHGEWSLRRVQREADKWFLMAKQAKERSTLPEAPDQLRAERLLMDMHRVVL